MFKCLDSAFEKEALLRIQHFGLAGSETEEPGVELIQVIQEHAPLHVVPGLKLLAAHASGQQFFVVELAQGFMASCEIPPECFNVVRIGEASCHANDGNFTRALPRAVAFVRINPWIERTSA
ncbi:hypothetical protein D3C71_1311020 [compost metagenome]